jgi:hypothetical protein
VDADNADRLSAGKGRTARGIRNPDGLSLASAIRRIGSAA